MRALLHVISYDIASDAARRRIAAQLEAVGVRVQDSVFEAHLTREAGENLLRALDLLRPDGDSIRMYVLPEDARAASRQVGGAPIGEATEFWLL